MAIYESTPPIVTNGLVLALDAANPKSYTPSENLLTYSNDFTNVVWTSGNVSITSSADISPDGTQNATLIKQDTATNRHVFSNRTYPSTISGSLYTLSFFVKPAGTNKLFVEYAWMGSQYSNAYFDVSTKTKIAGGLTPSYVDYPNGWTRVIITGTASTSSTATTNQTYAYIGLLDNSGSLSYTGDGTSGAYFYGFQMESNSFVTDYKNTTSSPIFRTNWNDLSGNNNNGILSGSSIPTFNASNIGSLSFTGGAFNTSYISEYSITDSFWNAGSWSVSTWVKFNVVNTGGSNDNAIVGHGISGINNQIHLGERSARVQFGLYSNDIGGSVLLSANTFYNIVWTYNYTSAFKQIYVNSILDGSGGNIRYTGTGNNTRIGSYSVNTFGLCFNGNLYNMQFYNKVLSAQEIQQNYNALKNRFNLG